MNQKELLIISITFFLTIVSWVLLDIYRVNKNIVIKDKIRKIQPVTFSIDADTVRQLKQRTP